MENHASQPNPATKRPDPKAQTFGLTEPVISQKELADLQLRVDQSLDEVSASLAAITEDYNVRAVSVIHHYRGVLADIMTNRTMLEVLATDVKEIAAAHPTSEIKPRPKLNLAGISLKPLGPTAGRLMLNGKNGNTSI